MLCIKLVDNIGEVCDFLKVKLKTMIWVESKNRNIKTLCNFPFIGQIFLMIIAVVPPVMLTLVIGILLDFSDQNFGMIFFSLIGIWCHFLWKNDVKIIVLFIPVWIVLLVFFLSVYAQLFFKLF